MLILTTIEGKVILINAKDIFLVEEKEAGTQITLYIDRIEINVKETAKTIYSLIAKLNIG